MKPADEARLLEEEARRIASRMRARAQADRDKGLEQISDEVMAANRADRDRVSELMARVQKLCQAPARPSPKLDAPERVPDGASGRQRQLLGVVPAWAGERGWMLRGASESLHASAQAHFCEYEVAPKVRRVALDLLGDLAGYENATERRRIAVLAETLSRTKEIEPIFVGVDADGDAYIMEGQHRARAFRAMGDADIPAWIVLDTSRPLPSVAQEAAAGEDGMGAVEHVSQSVHRGGSPRP